MNYVPGTLIERVRTRGPKGVCVNSSNTSLTLAFQGVRRLSSHAFSLDHGTSRGERSMELSRNSLFAALIATVALCWVNTARADHYSGGNITYRCLGGNFFEVTLDVYLDCSGAPLTSQNLQLSNDCGVAFTVNGLPLTLTEEVSQLCGASVPNSTCNGGTLPGIMHYQFVTTLFLSPCNDWTIAWDICCRTGLQNTSGTPGMYLEATVNNAGGLCDSSPVLADNSIPFVCVNQPVSYNTGFSDPDGNSMSFELIAARFASPAPTNINYSGGR